MKDMIERIDRRYIQGRLTLYQALMLMKRAWRRRNKGRAHTFPAK